MRRSVSALPISAYKALNHAEIIVKKTTHKPWFCLSR
jgi:hypothetical protein